MPNIGLRGRRRRWRGGWIWFAITVAAAWAHATAAAPWWGYPVLAVLYARAALGWFQALEKT